MREDEEGLVMDANNVTDDTFSHASSSQRQILNTIFTSDKLEKSDKLVNAINNFTINNAVYELITVTPRDPQGDLTRDPDTVTRISTGFLDKKVLSCRIIREVYVLPPPMN